MIRKPSRQDAKRLAVGSLVAATSFAGLGVAFASSADATSTALTATPSAAAYQSGASAGASTTATINVTSTGTPDHLKYRVTSGPDVTSGNTGLNCTSTTVCTITNTPGDGPGTDAVTIFDDSNNNGVLDNGEASTTTSVVFGGPIASLSVSPTGGNVGANATRVTTVTAKDNTNPALPATGSVVYATYTEVLPSVTQPTANAAPTAPTNPLSFVAPSTGGDSSNTAASVGGGVATTTTVSGTNTTYAYTATLTGQFTVNANGTIASGVKSTTAGTVTDKFANAASNPTVQTTDSYTVVGGQSGNDSVKALTVTPTTASAGLSGTVSYTVTALDATSNGNPVGNATVSYKFTSGPDQPTTNPTTYPTCTGTTDPATGQVTCSIQNNGTAGTDGIEFFVNQDTQGTITTGPDSGEPTVTATATFTQAPAYDEITLTCQDQSVGSTGTPVGASGTCYVPTGTSAQPVTFTATVYKTNGQGVETPVSGEPITFSAVSGVAVTLSPTSGITDQNGQATFTAKPTTNPNSGNSFTVRAQGVNSSYIGSGYSYAQATVNYLAAGTVASNVTLSPSAQSAQVGGTASVTATATDRFGNPVSGAGLQFQVYDRDGGARSATYNTNAQGKATYTVTDTGSNLTSGTSYVDVYYNGSEYDEATINWVLSTAATQLTFNIGTCQSAGSSTTVTTDSERVSADSDNEVCAVVQNANGDPLAGQSVTFAVSSGFDSANQVFNSTTTPTPTTTSVTVTTDSDGIAEAYVGSKAVGSQTVTATDGALSKTVTFTYTSGTISSITIDPTTATVAAGGTQKFTATAKDSFGNLATFQSLQFVQSGPGNIGGASSTQVPTDANGQASVTLSVPAGATGAGSVTVYPYNAGGTPNAVATYTVGTAGPATVSVTGDSVVVRNIATVTAKVTDNGGNPVANQVVNFAISGAQTATGTGTTDASGVATFSYRTTAAGSDTVTATAGSVSGTGTVAVGKQSVSINFGTYSPSKGKVTLVAIVSPATGAVVGQKVGFYQKSGSGYIGPISATIDSSGRAEVTVSRTSGTTYTFYAAVASSTNVNAAKSGTQSVKVK